VKPSPIQLLQLIFKHVKVELDPLHLPPEIPNPLTSVFTFDGVSIQTEVGVGESDPDHERGRMFFLELRVVVDNLTNPEAADQKYAPYKLDVAVQGVVLVPEGAEKLGPPEDLAAVNGAVMLWSAVREQVLSITSRMHAGPVMLPTVHFHDLKQGSTDKAQAAPTRPEKRPALRRTKQA
jgi:preprotein translocase subunit SecB